MRRRKYRLVQLLLFYEVPMFRNSVFRPNAADAGDEILYRGRQKRADERQRKSDDTRLHSNNAYTGFIDNVFNYHLAEREPDSHEHQLLQKVRFLQMCPTEEWERVEKLQTELRHRFGYNISNKNEIREMLLVLLRSGFIRIDGQNCEAYIQRTDKGSIVVETLMSRMTYLEHVFHQTLFPQVLIEEVRDLARSDDEDRWILSSICNCFIFLSYVNFVENYPANGIVIKAGCQVVPKIRASLAEAVSRMVTEDYRRNPHADPANWLVNRALVEIENTLNHWYARGALEANVRHAAD